MAFAIDEQVHAFDHELADENELLEATGLTGESLKRLDAYLDLTEVQKTSIRGVLKAEFDAKRESASYFILIPGTTANVRFEWTRTRVAG